MAGLKVNFSNEEASSEARDYDPLPTGKYPVTITEVKMEECGPNSKNPGKNYYNLELTIDEGHPNAGRKFWANVMLFDGALYSLGQLAKALNMEEQVIKKGNVPTADQLEGQSLVVRVQKQRDKYREEKAEESGDRDPSDPPLFKNEVKSYFSSDTSSSSTSAAASGSSSILP